MDDKEKKIVSRLSTVIVLLVVIIIILLVVIFFLFRNSRPTGCGTLDEPKTSCGNAPVLDRGMTMESFNRGKAVFRQNCAVCHSISDQHLTGPGLKGISDRIPNRPGWLEGYILNEDSVRRSGDAYARKVYEENAGAAMPFYKNVLSKEDLSSLICYLKANREY